MFTYKEGLLSVVAHDLKIRVAAFTITVDETTRAIEARFDATSLRVVSAMQDGKESRGTLSAANKKEIEGNIVRDVLAAAEYPEIRFVSKRVEPRGDGYLVTGTLALHGKQRALQVTVRQDGERYVAEARVHQPDFGIRPYSALFGTLKVQADVTVRVTVPSRPPA